MNFIIQHSHGKLNLEGGHNCPPKTMAPDLKIARKEQLGIIPQRAALARSVAQLAGL